MTLYNSHGMFNSDFGLPLSEEQKFTFNNVDIIYIEFTFKTMFYISTPNNTPIIFNTNNALMKKYKDGCIEYGLIIADEISGYIESTYENNCVITKEYFYLPCENYTLCSLKTSINKTVDSSSTNYSFVSAMPTDIFNYFVDKGGLDAQKNYGDYKFPCSCTKKTRSNIQYQNFNRGVILKYPNKPVLGILDLKIVLINVNAGEIDDAGLNRVPDLFIEVYLKHNSTYIRKKERWPTYSVKKYRESNLDIIYEESRADKTSHLEGSNVYYVLENLKGEDNINLRVRVCDYDTISHNDMLGTYNLDFDIEKVWGLIQDNYSTNFYHSQVLYSEIHPDILGEDNENGKENIRFTFRIECKQDDFDLSENFRKYGFWSIDNYKTHQLISRDCFNTVFSSQRERWYDWGFRILDSVWFCITKFCFSPKNGNCFGLSLEALGILNGNGIYGLPLLNLPVYSDPIQENLKLSNSVYIEDIDKENLTQGFVNRIEQKHIYQAGWQHMLMVIHKIAKGNLFIPSLAINDIISMLDKYKYCLVHLLSFESCHTVLAYGVRYDNGTPIVLVADSNLPWYSTSNNSNNDCCFIKINSQNTVTTVILEKNGKIFNYNYIYGTPYYILKNNPKVPSLWDICASIPFICVSLVEFAIYNTIGFFMMLSSGDVAVTDTTSDLEEKNLEPFNLPISGNTISNGSSTQLYKYNSSVKFISGAVNNTLSFKIIGNNKGNYTQHIISRNKVITLEGHINKNDICDITISRFMQNNPTVVINSNHKVTIIIENLVTKYGKNSNINSDLKHNPNNTMKHYFINSRSQTNKDHEMHVEGCKLAPTVNQVYLGAFKNEFDALAVAKSLYPTANGCYSCCPGTDTDTHQNTSTNSKNTYTDSDNTIGGDTNTTTDTFK